MPATYHKIQTITLASGSQANIEFTGIPGTYKNLLILASTRITGNAGGMYLTFNGTTTNYGGTRMGANPVSGGGSEYSDSNAGLTNKLFVRTLDSRASANHFGNGEIYIVNYTDSVNKNIFMHCLAKNSGTTYDGIEMNYGLWSNTAIITSIKIVPEAGDFAQHSKMTLYGISYS